MNLLFSSFKESVYNIVDKEDNYGLESKLSDILCNYKISILGYINGHDRYAKIKECIS